MPSRLLSLCVLVLSGCIDKIEDDCAFGDEICGGQEGSPDGSVPGDAEDDEDDETEEDPSFDMPGEPEVDPDEDGLRSGQGTGGIPGANTWCWVIEAIESSISLIEVDLETAAWTEIGRYETDLKFSGFRTDGLARLGDTVVFAGYGWVQIDLAAETLTYGGKAATGSVASDGSRLFIYDHHSGGRYFDSYADLVADAPSATFDAHLHSSRQGAADGLIYAAWHSTNAIDVHDGATGEWERTIALEDYDTWVRGVSVAGGALHLIDDGRGGDSEERTPYRLARFDLETGALLGDLYFSDLDRPSGLWCEEYEEEATP